MRWKLPVGVSNGILVSGFLFAGANCLVDAADDEDERPAKVQSGIRPCLGGALLGKLGELALDKMWDQARGLCACIEQEVNCQACCDHLVSIAGDPTFGGPLVDCYLDCNPGGSDAPECEVDGGALCEADDDDGGAQSSWSSGGWDGGAPPDSGGGGSDPGAGGSNAGSGASDTGTGASDPGGGTAGSTSGSSSSGGSGTPSGGGGSLGLCFDSSGTAPWCIELHDKYSCEYYSAYGCVWVQ